MSVTEKSVESFMKNLPVGEVYSDKSLTVFITESGLPKEDFLRCDAFSDFVLARLALESLALRISDTASEKTDEKEVVLPLIAENENFAEKYMHFSTTAAKMDPNYLSGLVDVAVRAKRGEVREEAFSDLLPYVERGEFNALRCFSSECVKELTLPHYFYDLVDKQVKASEKILAPFKKKACSRKPARQMTEIEKAIAFIKDDCPHSFEFNKTCVEAIETFAEKFPGYKDSVYGLLKKAEDYNLIEEGEARDACEELLQDVTDKTDNRQKRNRLQQVRDAFRAQRFLRFRNRAKQSERK